MSDSGDIHTDLHELTLQVGRLTQRVIRLEHRVTLLGGETPVHPAEPTPPARPPAPAQPAPRQPASRPVAPPLPHVAARPMREPIDWPKLAAQAFTARTLAWAGGVATALGVVLLFVVASSRGWITPGMRVGAGVLVSLGLLAAAFELDRRKWRADAILAAAGAGIAGLYASLWAAVSAYHLVGRPLGLTCAALIAGLAVVAAIRIAAEPLAIFGIVGAMLAPVLVAHDVTGGRRPVRADHRGGRPAVAAALRLGSPDVLHLVDRCRDPGAAVSSAPARARDSPAPSPPRSGSTACTRRAR